MARGKKTGGRKYGTRNRKTKEELDRAGRVLCLIESKYLEKDIGRLTPHQRTQLYVDMMEYKAPKLTRIEANVKAKITDLAKLPIVFE